MRTPVLFVSVIATIAAAVLVAANAAEPAGIAKRPTDAGWYLTTDSNETLYTYDADKDHPGQSACGELCAETWPPLAAPADASPNGDWSIIPRKNDQKQWAYRGSPLYRFKMDQPGMTSGDGSEKVWHVVFQPIPTPPGVKIGSTILGRALVDGNGMTLYTPANPKDASQACKEGCIGGDWHPLSAPWLAKTRDDWSAIKRADGLVQWAFRGQPLYTFAGDDKIGDIKGDSHAGWHAVVLEKAPALPAWVKIEHADLGPLFANADGMTLYRFFPANIKRLKELVCNDDCIRANWAPVLAAEDAAPIGNWRPVDGPGGQKQWSYKGGLVYTFIHDRRPGDAFGDKFAGMESPWSPILQASLILSGP